MDHTLLDSVASEQKAFRDALAVAGLVDDDSRYFAAYDPINRELWAAVERGEVDPEEVRYERFRRFVDHCGLAADPVEMADAFVAGLAGHGNLLPGARESLDLLKPCAEMALVTNGISEIQRARIARLGLAEYFSTIAISGELGRSKPGVEIFEWVFDQVESPNKETTLMIGDSLTSDMQGGFNFGIDTCWYNPNGLPAPNSGLVTHQVAALPRIVDLLALGG